MRAAIWLLIATVQAQSIDPAKLPRAGVVDDRFQSYNVEMVEVTGGRFWKPYKATGGPGAESASTPAGMDPNLYRQRPPIDLSNPRLRKLAAALGPAYLRVSGTWANNSYFHNSDEPAPQKPPQGFGGVLTRAEWKGVVDFARAAAARLVTSFATSAGTRDAAGLWTPAQARELLAYTKTAGGSIAAAEYMNEPTFAEMGGAPKGYSASHYARDVRVFIRFMREASPGTILLGPGGVAEGVSLGPSGVGPKRLPTEDLLRATGPVFDVFSYHSYGAASKRCGGGGALASTPATALSDDVLSRADRIEQFYADLRDRFEPGKPMWLTETADAACGGNPWASTFLDSFRYLDQMGRLAKRGVQVHMHNTLAASDYGLLEEDTFAPRPNYWAALLWRKLMGSTVLDAGVPAPGLHVYAQCLRDNPGGVALLAINTDAAASRAISLPANAERYTLTAAKPEDTTVRLNGKELHLAAGDALPELAGTRTAPGRVTFAPSSITFLALTGVHNPSCR